MNNLSPISDLPSPHHHLDTTGLICPEPVMLLHKEIRNASIDDVIEVIATDPATTRDIPNFCRHLGHDLLNIEESEAPIIYKYLIQKK